MHFPLQTLAFWQPGIPEKGICTGKECEAGGSGRCAPDPAWPNHAFHGWLSFFMVLAGSAIVRYKVFHIRAY